VLSHGLGVNSAAVTVEYVRRGIRPDLILFADVKGEKQETYDYLTVMNDYLAAHGFPPIVTVEYRVTDYKHWPPYRGLEQNCLTNGTLPSLAFGFKSCSLKWKAKPQWHYVRDWQPAKDAWAEGLKVRRVIGYDAGPADIRRKNHLGDPKDKRFSFHYPLIEWGWDRERCKEEIIKAGLPVPPKSSCFFCPSMKTHEVRDLPADKLRRIVVMEARAAPRLEKIEGLWRNGCKGTRGGEKKPGRMSDFIVEEGLLSAAEVENLRKRVPLAIVDAQGRHAAAEPIQPWDELLDGLAGFAEAEECGAEDEALSH
jgi:hypothetical protein